jgi:2'-5' RNA ligase
MGGTTAIVVPVPAAAPLVRRAGGHHRRLVRREQPPHVTVVWPFLPAVRLDRDTHAELQRLAAAMPSFTTTFDRIAAFPDVTYLAPADAEPFVRLTEAVAVRWPECPPYGGRFAEVVPHITLCDGAPPAGVRFDDLVPLVVRVTELELAVDHRWRGWRTRGRYRLGDDMDVSEHDRAIAP